MAKLENDEIWFGETELEPIKSLTRREITTKKATMTTDFVKLEGKIAQEEVKMSMSTIPDSTFVPVPVCLVRLNHHKKPEITKNLTLQGPTSTLKYRKIAFYQVILAMNFELGLRVKKWYLESQEWGLN